MTEETLFRETQDRMKGQRSSDQVKQLSIQRSTHIHSTHSRQWIIARSVGLKSFLRFLFAFYNKVNIFFVPTHNYNAEKNKKHKFLPSPLEYVLQLRYAMYKCLR